MSCNLKVASIVVATLAITFSSMTLVQLCSTFFKEEKQQIDQGGIVVPPTSTSHVTNPHSPIYKRRVLKGSTSTHPKLNTAYLATTSKPATTKVDKSSKKEKTLVSIKSPSSKKVETDKEFMARLNNRKTTPAERAIGIIVCVVSIFTSFMIFGAVTDDYDYNAMKRHLVLPFVVVQYLTNFFHIVVIFYTACKYSERLNVLIVPLLAYAAMVFVSVVGVSFIGAYFRSLRAIGSRSYFQMDDEQDVEVDEQKSDTFNEKKHLPKTEKILCI